MRDKGVLLSFLLFFIMIYIAGIFVFNDTTLLEHRDVVSFDSSTFELRDMEEGGSGYSPISDSSSIAFSVDGALTDRVSFTLSEPLQNAVSVTVYRERNGKDPVELGSWYVKSGTRSFYMNTPKKRYSKVFLTVSGTFPLEQVNFTRAYVNPVQNNHRWIITQALIITASILLAFALVFVQRKSKSAPRVAKQRESSIELLRILMMIGITSHHLIVHGQVLGHLNMGNTIFAYILIPFGKLCFDAFIAISMWFLSDQNFRGSRFIRTYLEVFFYSVALTIVTSFWGVQITPRNFLSAFPVMLGNSHGFAASYLLAYLLIPFVRCVLRRLNRIQARYLLLLAFYVQVCSRIIGQFNGYFQPVFSEVCLFLFCFILSYNLRHWPVKLQDNGAFCAFLGFGIYGMILGFNLMHLYGRGNAFTQFILSISGDESSLANIAAGYGLFLFVKRIHIRQSRVINAIAPLTFGVLLIHDHNFLRSRFWYYFVHTNIIGRSEHFIVFVLASVAGIFFTCCVIDYLRLELLERMVMKSHWIRILAGKLDLIYDEVDGITREDTRLTGIEKQKGEMSGNG